MPPSAARRRSVSNVIPMIEPLEPRALRSVSLSGGVLTVTGTSKSDRIFVALEAKHPTKIDVTINKVTTVYPLRKVSRLVVNALGGNDLISVGQTGPSFLRGEQLTGGTGNDTILDGNGNDH